VKLYFETEINLPFEKVRDHFSKDLFLSLSPDFIPFKLKRYDGCKKGDQVHIELGPGKLAQEWMSLITFDETNASGWSFIDEGKILPWPLSYWKHHHRVDKLSSTSCKIVDDIHYECSPAILTFLIKPFLWSVFAIRPERYKKYFEGLV
jgi:ligand-binding SRPBCC domain-containing protein